MKIKKILISILSIMLLMDLIFFPFLFEGGSLFNEGLKVYKYLLGSFIVIIIWVYFVINFIPKIENSISYKIATIAMQERHKESFNFHYKIIFKITSFLICIFIILLFILSVKNFNLVLSNMVI
jgi:hypothetical protein